MPNTIRICGVDYSPCWVIERGGIEGIETQTKVFWLTPSCDGDGHAIKKRRPYPPREIRQVTTTPPDLTKDFPNTVSRLLTSRREYWEKTHTLEQYLADYPDTPNPPTQEAFNH